MPRPRLYSPVSCRPVRFFAMVVWWWCGGSDRRQLGLEGEGGHSPGVGLLLRRVLVSGSLGDQGHLLLEPLLRVPGEDERLADQAPLERLERDLLVEGQRHGPAPACALEPPLAAIAHRRGEVGVDLLGDDG